jgi:hypothetical protein
MPKVDPRNEVGVIVHAISKNVLGDHTAKNVYGNVNYAKTFIRGTVMNVFNGVCRGGRMNNMTTNMTTNTTTDTTTDTELEREQPNPQLAKHVVGEVHGIHPQDIPEQAPKVTLEFPPRCSSTNSAATAFIVLNHSHQPFKNQQSTIKKQKMVAKRTAEVWRQPPAEDSNAAVATAKAMEMAFAMVATKAMVEGNGCDEGNGIVDDSSSGGGEGKGNGNCCSEGSSIGTALRAILVVPAEARPMAVAIGAVRATMLMTIVVVAVAEAMITAAVTVAAAAAMVRVEARATAMVVASLPASGGGNSGDGTTTDVRNAILPPYADVIDVRRDNDGDCIPAFDGGNIDGGIVDFDKGMRRTCGGQQR